MTTKKTWPKVGQKLVHNFRSKHGFVEAEVIAVDKKTESVTVRVKGKTYSSLSTAARAISGSPTNGWVFWGLKSQSPRKKD